MKIVLASDHKGYHLKTSLITYLTKKGYDIIDCGTNDVFSTDYPKYAFKLCEEVKNHENSLGIAICGTGIGISIACNKVKGIRCAKVDNVKEAQLTRNDNNSNVLALNGGMRLYKAKDIVDAFLTANFSNEERHVRRIDMIKQIEEGKYDEC